MRQSMESESPSSTHGQERWALVGESGSLGDLGFWGGRSQTMEGFKYYNKEFRLYPVNIWFLSREVT